MLDLFKTMGWRYRQLPAQASWSRSLRAVVYWTILPALLTSGAMLMPNSPAVLGLKTIWKTIPLDRQFSWLSTFENVIEKRRYTFGAPWNVRVDL
jgi:hypothetical protein